MIWTREQAKALIERALSMGKADETLVTLTRGDRANPPLVTEGLGDAEAHVLPALSEGIPAARFGRLIVAPVLPSFHVGGLESLVQHRR